MNDTNKVKRLVWAKEHEHWSVSDWMRVIWTDEAAFYIGGFRGNVWVTRNPEEEYNEQCLIPRFQKLSHVMVWGAIVADRTGPLVVWDNSWGKICSQSYLTHITRPVLAPFYEKETYHSWPYCTYVMQDGAPAHRGKLTLAEEKSLRIICLDWPASSPDLNLIETLWCNMKKRLYDLPLL